VIGRNRRDRRKGAVFGGVAAVAVGLLGVMLVAIASADPPQTVGGVTYRHDSVPANPPALAIAEVKCPGATHASGGGSTSESGTKGRLQMSAPVDGADSDRIPGDIWRARHAYSPGDGAETQNVYVICLGESLTYMSRTTVLHPGQAGAVTVSCGRTRHVTGGGAALSRTSAAGFVNSSYPVDSGDAGAAPDDGWSVRAFNGSAADMRVRVNAMCSNTARTYRSGAQTIAPGTANFAHASCPDAQHVVGLGAKVSGRAKDAPLTSVSNGDGADADFIPDDNTNAGAAISSGAPIGSTLTAFAICRS